MSGTAGSDSENEENISLNKLARKIKLGADLSLKEIVKNSDSAIWGYFGCLYKKNVLVSAQRDRFFCRPCFQNGDIKG